MKPQARHFVIGDCYDLKWYATLKSHAYCIEKPDLREGVELDSLAYQRAWIIKDGDMACEVSVICVGPSRNFVLSTIAFAEKDVPLLKQLEEVLIAHAGLRRIDRVRDMIE